MKHWYKVWPKDVPKSLEYEELSLVDVLRIKSTSLGSRILAFHEDGNSRTLRDLEDISNRIANSLESFVKEGEKALIMMFNRLEFLDILFALWKIRVVPVIIDPLTTSEDLEFHIQDSKPSLIITEKEIYQRERDVLNKYSGKIVTLDGKIDNTLDYKGLLGEYKRIETNIKPKVDIALVLYYAGIAGRTMQVLHKHFGLYANALASSTMGRFNENDIILDALPLSHIFGFLPIFYTLISNSRIILSKKFDTRKTARLIEDYKVTKFLGVPLMYESFLKEIEPKTLSSLKVCMSGAAYLPPELQKAFMDKFNVPLVQIYGMTEALLVTMQPIELKNVIGTVGIPAIDVDVKIMDPNDPEKELGVNETGELLVKSPWIMKGYSDESENARVFLKGWLRTGDLLMMNDDGLFFFKGVKKRMIKYKGYPIFPRDLELILSKHPAVKEVFVTGEKDPSVGEIPVAYVVPRGNVSEDELLKFVNSKVAFYKKLRKIYLVKEIPK